MYKCLGSMDLANSQIDASKLHTPVYGKNTSLSVNVS